VLLDESAEVRNGWYGDVVNATLTVLGDDVVLRLAYLFAALLQASPPPNPRETCSSVETPQGMLFIDRVAAIFFESGSARISAQGLAVLDNYAAYYNAPARCHVIIGGHADRVGSAAANLKLSRRRVLAVVAYLRSRGVGAPFTLHFFGDTRPLVEAPNGVAEAQNRRVELFVSEP